MKLHMLLTASCLLLAGTILAETGATDSAPAATTPAKPHHKKKKKKKIPAKAPATTQSSAAPTPAATAPAVIQAAAPKTDSFQSWLEGIKKRLTQSDTRANKVVAVAAVRGDETPDSPPLYWKGAKPEVRDDVPERKDFEAAVDLALKGDKPAAKERLQSFLIAYPKSSYAPDAKETLSRLDAN